MSGRMTTQETGGNHRERFRSVDASGNETRLTLRMGARTLADRALGLHGKGRLVPMLDLPNRVSGMIPRKRKRQDGPK